MERKVQKHIILFTLLALIANSCVTKIDPENKVLIIAKRSDKPLASKNGASVFKYYWQNHIYHDLKSFNALNSKQYDYFLLYIDKADPEKWVSFSRGKDYGYSDTIFIPDTLRLKIHIDSADFKLLEQEH